MLRQMRSHIKLIMAIVIFLFVISCFGGYGLYIRSGKGGGGGNRDYPVAEVGGRNVMRSELENGVGRIAEQYSQSKEITSGDLPQLRKAVIDGIAVQAEIEKEIKSRNIDVTDDEINEEYKKIMDSYPTREEFMANMQRSGTTEKAVKDDLRKQISQQKLMDLIQTDVKVSDAEARGFYNTAKGFLYKQPAGTMVNLALFKNSAAAKLAQKALEGGANWDKVMEEHKAKADIKTFTPYNKPVLMTDKIMSGPMAKLKDYPMDKVSPVISVTSEDNYIAIKRAKSPERILSFNEVSADVIALLKNQKIKEKQDEFYKTLLDRAEIKILDPKIFPSAPQTGVKSEDKQ
ncbi:MAG: SurA N-terminal domain-containing protein [Synergistaceae bacterium]|nr:SurA N-terminal domain-containing protein [Synergistaceae bacterium]